MIAFTPQKRYNSQINAKNKTIYRFFRNILKWPFLELSPIGDPTGFCKFLSTPTVISPTIRDGGRTTTKGAANITVPFSF